MGDLFALLIGAVLVNNVVLTRFVSMGQILAFSKRFSSALYMGVAAMAVMASSAVVNFILYTFLLEPMGFAVMDLVVYVLVISLMTWLAARYIRSSKPEIYEEVKGLLPLLTINSAVLFIALDNVNQGYDLGQAVVNAIGLPVGLFLAFAVFGAIKERLDFAEETGSFRGAPILLAVAGLAAMALSGLAGLV